MTGRNMRSPRCNNPAAASPQKQRRLVMVAKTSTATKLADPNVVNGINVDDLLGLIEDVKQDAAKGMTDWHVTTTWQGQTRSRAQVDGFEIGGKQVPRRFSI